MVVVPDSQGEEYVCVSKCLVRETIEMKSAEVGHSCWCLTKRMSVLGQCVALVCSILSLADESMYCLPCSAPYVIHPQVIGYSTRVPEYSVTLCHDHDHDPASCLMDNEKRLDDGRLPRVCRCRSWSLAIACSCWRPPWMTARLPACARTKAGHATAPARHCTALVAPRQHLQCNSTLTS